MVSNMLSDRDHLVVLGDFNIPGAIWSLNNSSNTLQSSTQHDFITGLFDISLSQVNHVRNSLGRLLDLCFVSDPARVSLARVAPLTQPEDPYHPTFDVTLDIGANLQNISDRPAKRVYCFGKSDFDRLNNFIYDFNWSDLYMCTDMAAAVDIFYNAMNSFFSECVPL